VTIGSVSQLASKSGASKIRWISFFMITPPGESFFEGLSALFERDPLCPVVEPFSRGARKENWHDFQASALAPAAQAIPLLYVNLKPAEETLPKGVAYIGSDENVSGRLQGEEIARLLNNKVTSSSWWASLRPRLPFCVPGA
jgi:hypothetical protein